jgi:branched-chain amino acid transport system permease protein
VIAPPRGLAGRLADGLAASAALFALLVGGCWLYTSTGGAARDLLVQELLINLMLVLGLQIFIGNTGILSFGHLAFTQIAAYGAALTLIPVSTKETSLPDIPFGLGGVELGPVAAAAAGTGIAILVGAVVGTAIARAGGLAATMISLAVLFVVDQVVKSWQELTKGAGGLAGVPRLGTNTPVWIVAAAALVVTHLFRTSRVGRFALAGREDEIAAPAIGVSLFWSRWAPWVVSVAVVAVAGAVRVQAVGSTNPKQYTLDVGVLLLAMLVAGGMRTVTGAFVGTALITVGNEAARQFGDRHEIARLPDLFLGVVLLAVMLVRPGGLLGDVDLAAWLARQRQPNGRLARQRQPNGRLARQRQRQPDAATGAAPAPDGRGEAPAIGPLTATGIVVRFGGFTALDGAGLQVKPGEIVGLIGPNGAGKTTLFNVVTGIVTEQAGRVAVGDRDLSTEPSHRIARAGLARTFQNLRLFGNLSVRENVDLAATAAATYRRHRPRPDADALLAAAGLAGMAERPARTLDYGNQRRLELARAAALAPDYLLLDEPTSGMSDAESLAMVDHVRTTARAVGAGVLVIDHDLAFITRISDHVVVLAEGRVLAEGTPADVRANPAVAAAYLGAEG